VPETHRKKITEGSILIPRFDEGRLVQQDAKPLRRGQAEFFILPSQEGGTEIRERSGVGKLCSIEGRMP